MIGLTACTFQPEQSNLEEEIRTNPYISFTRQKALEVIQTGFNAGDGYEEVWIRDYNTFIELAASVFEPAVLKEQLLVFFRPFGPERG